MNLRRDDWLDRGKVLKALREGDGAGVKLAVIDSGIEVSHPALEGLVLEDDWAISDIAGVMKEREGLGLDVFGHGTAVASLVRQFAPGAMVGSFRVLSASNGSRNHLIRAGVLKAIERGYRILNCSFGCRDDDGKHAMTYKDWVDRAYLAGVHVVTACNNEDFGHQEWPGFFSTCINVNMAAGIGQGFTYRPDHLVEFAATGVDLELPWKNGTYKRARGSSFAAPVVAAYLARLIAAFPSLSVIQAKALLQHYGEEWRDIFKQDNVSISYHTDPVRRPHQP